MQPTDFEIKIKGYFIRGQNEDFFALSSKIAIVSKYFVRKPNVKKQIVLNLFETT